MAGVIAAVIGAVGAIGGATISKNASDNAADKAKAATKSNLTLQKYMYDQTRTDQEPWRKAGASALGRLENPLASFEASPDYQFRKDSGLEGIAQSKAVGGLLKSGSALTDLVGFNSNLAAGEYGDYINRQMAMAGLGQTANAANQQAGQFYASAANQANQQNAMAQMQSAYQQGNAWSQALGQTAGIFANALANYGGRSTGGNLSGGQAGLYRGY